MTKAIADKVWVQKSEVSRPQHVIQENLWKLHLWTLQVSSAEKQKFVLGVAHAHDLFIRCWGHYTVPLCQNMPKHPIRQETMTTRPEQMLCGVLIIEAESTSASTATSGSGRSCSGAGPLAISCFPSPNHTWRFVPASPACPSKSFSCSSVTLHIARSKKPGSSWQYIQPFGKLLISSLTSSKEMLSDNLSYISSAKQGFYDHQIGNCMKLQPHQPHQAHQPLLEDFQRRVCSYPLYLSAAAPWDVQTCDVHPINSHSAPVPGSFCMLLATSASHPAQTRCI